MTSQTTPLERSSLETVAGPSTTALPLNEANLPAIADFIKRHHKEAHVEPLPTYPRALGSFESLICHIGVGGFHRSHQAVFTHELLVDQQRDAQEPQERWGIVGVGLRAAKTRDALAPQDFLYTVLARPADGEAKVTVVGSIVDFKLARDDGAGEGVVAVLADPRTRIVSLTLTEKGYFLDPSTGRLDTQREGVRHDLDRPNERCVTAVGTLCKALGARKAQGLPPFTVLSCDNLPGNGALARVMVLGFLAAAGDAALTDWVAAQGAFPNTVVDRITPHTSPLDAATPCRDRFSNGVRLKVAGAAGCADAFPVVAEPFKQWVVEDRFVGGRRPQWERRGVVLADDVHPYQDLKLRLLNAGHSALAYAGYLMGHRFVDCAMESPPLQAFLGRFLDEQLPTVAPVPGVDLAEYRASVLARFGNPSNRDTLRRLAQDGSLKLATTMREPALANARAGRPVGAFAVVVATWARYVVGVDEEGGTFEVEDPRAAELTRAARHLFGTGADGALPVAPPHSVAEVAAFLSAVLGDTLAKNGILVAAVRDALADLAKTDTRCLVLKFLDAGCECEQDPH